jgi:hypothetical protein
MVLLLLVQLLQQQLVLLILLLLLPLRLLHPALLVLQYRLLHPIVRGRQSASPIAVRVQGATTKSSKMRRHPGKYIRFLIVFIYSFQIFSMRLWGSPEHDVKLHPRSFPPVGEA